VILELLNKNKCANENQLMFSLAQPVQILAGIIVTRPGVRILHDFQ